MAETNSIPTPTPTAVTQSTYEEPGTRRPWPMRSTLDVKDFIAELRHEQNNAGDLSAFGFRLYVNDRREVVGVVADDAHQVSEWINGWADTYPCGRVAIMRQIAREALGFDATGVILIASQEMELDIELPNAAQAAPQIAETLRALGVSLLDIGVVQIGVTPSGFEMASIFNTGRWGDGTGADRATAGATLQ